MKPKDERNAFAELLDSWTTRPAMYLINRVEDIDLLILGYRLGAKADGGMDWFDGFRAFVNKKYRSKEDFSWSSLIRLWAGGSDRRTVDAFRELLVAYCKKEKIVLPTLSLKKPGDRIEAEVGDTTAAGSEN